MTNVIADGDDCYGVDISLAFRTHYDDREHRTKQGDIKPKNAFDSPYICFNMFVTLSVSRESHGVCGHEIQCARKIQYILTI